MENALLIVALMERQLLVGAMSVRQQSQSSTVRDPAPPSTPHRARATTDHPQKVSGERMERQPPGLQERDAVPQPYMTKRRRQGQAAVAAPASSTIHYRGSVFCPLNKP